MTSTTNNLTWNVTAHELQNKIADTLNKELGTDVDVTFCRDNQMSVFGSPADVFAARRFIVDHSIATFECHDAADDDDPDYAGDFFNIN